MNSSPRMSLKRRRNPSGPMKPMNTTMATVSAAVNNNVPPCLTIPFPLAVLNHFSLLDLPAELRNGFYRACLQRPYSIWLHDHRDMPDFWPPLPETSDPAPDIVCISPLRPFAPVNRINTSYSEPRQPPQEDPLIPAILRTNKQIYNEARAILYQENTFILHIETTLTALTRLPQRSRSLIRHVHLRIRTHREILDKFTDIVRLGLRYCWGLKLFVITLPTYPDDGWRHWSGLPREECADVDIYANAFHILRWLPRGCGVKLEDGGGDGGGEAKGEGSGKGKDGWAAVRRVVEEHKRLVVSVDEKSYTAIQFYPANAGLA